MNEADLKNMAPLWGDEGGSHAALQHQKEQMMFTDQSIRRSDSRNKPTDVDDGQQWLNEIKQRMKKEKRITETVFLSPSRAKALLGSNPDNRKISSRTAETYAADIANGRWVFNGEAVIVAETGELNDGQHRCEAVVLAGKGIEVLLVAGVPRASRTTVDMGRARTTGDFLHMHNIENANAVAAAAQMLLAYETDRVMGYQRGVAKNNNMIFCHTMKPTKAEVLAFARENMADLERAMSALNKTKAGVVASFSRLAGILCIIARHSKDWPDAIAYMTSVIDGDNLKKLSPEYTVRERLLSERRNGSLGPIGFMEIVIRGWNARRAKQRISHIKLGGYLPEISR